MSDDVGGQIAKLFEKISHLEGLLERTHRPGTVTDVDYSDPTKPRIRIGIGTDADGKPVKGPWVPHMQHAGARMIHTPVSVGQQMLMVSPDGNFENGVCIPYGFSKPMQSPSKDKDTHVDQLGKTKNTIKDGTWIQETEGASITMTKKSIILAVGDTKVAITDGKIVSTADKIAAVGNVSLGKEDADRELSLKGTIDSAGHSEQGNLSTKVKGI